MTGKTKRNEFIPKGQICAGYDENDKFGDIGWGSWT